jgi:hypothetical protein
MGNVLDGVPPLPSPHRSFATVITIRSFTLISSSERTGRGNVGGNAPISLFRQL